MTSAGAVIIISKAAIDEYCTSSKLAMKKINPLEKPG